MFSETCTFKEKLVRRNNAPCIGKETRKVTIHRSRLKRKILKFAIRESLEKTKISETNVI